MSDEFFVFCLNLDFGDGFDEGLFVSTVSLTPASPYKFAWRWWYLGGSWWRILWRGARAGLIVCAVEEMMFFV